MANTKKRMWKSRSRTAGFEWQGELIAIWEVALDPISDDYTPEEISAEELLGKWADQVRGKYKDDLIPIFWSVEARRQSFEVMPFQFEHNPELTRKENFITFFEWPVDARTGEPLNWLTLPVADKRWNKTQANKGGFIQEATGWKPSILQPHVYLRSLMEGRR